MQALQVAGLPRTQQACATCRLAASQAHPELSLEVVPPEPATSSALIEGLANAPPASPLLAEAAEALASTLTCTRCKGPVGRSVQQALVAQGALPVVAQVLRTSLGATANQAPHQGPPPTWLQPVVAALSLLVEGMPAPALVCLMEDGWPLMKAVLSRAPRAPVTHAHVCTILTALFPCWGALPPPSPSSSPVAPPSPPQGGQHAEVLILVANLSAANAQHGHLDAARTATWALACMALHAASHPSMSDPQLMPLPHQQQLWVMLTSQVMLTVMDLLASVAKQDHALAKHCLWFIEVVAGACLMGGPSAAVAAAGDGSATQFLRDAMLLAASVLKQSSELKLQVAALRCMNTLLGHPQVQGTMLADEDTLSALLRATSVARFTPGANPKDVALMQVYGMCVLSQLLQPDSLEALQQAPAAPSIGPEVLASVGAVVAFAQDAAQATASLASHSLDGQPWLHAPHVAWMAEERAHEVEPKGRASCRLGPACLSSHEDLTAGALVAIMGGACAQVLHWCRAAGHAPAGVNLTDAQGATVLHRLAAAGLVDAVRAYCMAAGPALELGKQDASGLTASDVAGLRGHAQLAAMLRAVPDPTQAVPAPAQQQQQQRAAPPPQPLQQQQEASNNGWSAMRANSLVRVQVPDSNALASTDPEVVPAGSYSNLLGAAAAWPASPSTGVSAPGTASTAGGPAAPPPHTGSVGNLVPRAHPGPSPLGPGAPVKTHNSLAGPNTARNAPSMPSTALSAAPTASAADLEDSIAGLTGLADNGFRVNTAALSQLILDSMVQQGGSGGTLASSASLPSWLSAGVAAAVNAHEEVVASAAAAGAAGAHYLRAEDLALIADAESLLNSQPLLGGLEHPASSESSGGTKHASKHLWLGNLSTKLPRSVLKAVFEHFGVVEDVVTFPGRMYAFVNFRNAEDAIKAAAALNDREVPPLTGNRRLVVKFRPSKKALGKSAEGPGADAAAAAAAAAAAVAAAQANGAEADSSNSGHCTKAPGSGALSPTAHAASEVHHAKGNSGGTSIRTGTSTNNISGSEASPPPDASSSDPSERGGDALSKCGTSGTQQAPGDGAAASAAATQRWLQKDGGVSGSGGQSGDSLTCGGGSGSGSAGDASNTGSSTPNSCAAGEGEGSSGEGGGFMEGKPSRHLWLGNVPLRPNKHAMEQLFGQYGQLESVRVFPGKTYAFVNFMQVEDAVTAKTVLDGQATPAITGLKPLVVRFQKESATACSSPSDRTPLDHAASNPLAPSTPGAGAVATPNELLPAAATSSCDLGPRRGSGGGVPLETQPSTSSVTSSSTATPVGERIAPTSPTAASPAARSVVLERDGKRVARAGATPGSDGVAAAGRDSGIMTKESVVDALLAGEAGKAVSNLVGLAAATGLSKLLDDDLPPEPAINLSNRLNPNNIHFDKELAARYKRMTKAEKEALWAQDRLMQQMASSSAAAALLSATAGAGTPANPLLGGAGSLGLGASKQLAAMGAGLPGSGAEQLAAELQRMGLAHLLPHGGVAGSNAQNSAAAQWQAAAAAAAGTAGLGGRLPPSAASLLSANNAALLQAQQALQTQQALQILSSSNAAAMQALAQEQQKVQQQQQLLNALGAQGGNASNQLHQLAQLQQQLLGLSLAGSAPGAGGFGKDGFGGGYGSGQAASGQLDMAALMRAGALNSPGPMSNQASGMHGARASHGHGHGLMGGHGAGAQGGVGLSSNLSQLDNALLANLGARDSPALLQQLQQQQLLQQLLPGGGGGAGSNSHAAASMRDGGMGALLTKLPANFLCPLSGQLMLDPVVAADGLTYDRPAITQWLAQHTTSPVTRMPLASSYLAPNHNLKNIINNQLARMGL